MTSITPPIGSASESSQPSLATPFISVKGLRKILGKDAENLDDDHIRKVGITLGEMALTLTTNPDFLNNLTESEEESNDGKTRYRTILAPDERDDTAKKVEDVLGYFLDGNSVADTV